MKRSFKTISALALALVLVLSLGVTAYADGSVSYQGGAEKFVFLEGSGYTDTDLFNGFKNVMPGDIISQDIVIKNGFGGAARVKIYMRAVLHDEAGNPLSYSEAYENLDGKDQTQVPGLRDETVVSMADFLSQLTMTVRQGDKVLFSASPAELDGFSSNVLLGSFPRWGSTTLTVDLYVPIELGNEYANRVGEVDWVFTAEEITATGSPKTGDEANLGLWTGLMSLSFTATAAAFFLLRKKNGAR